MPIKFRCSHCRQFLGISRTQAGQVVDCPTCGRSIRVPDLDGRRRPLPQPELDLGDSRLAQALDELAQLNFEAAEGAAAPTPPPPHAAAEILAPAPLPAPTPLDPPVPLSETPVVIKPAPLPAPPVSPAPTPIPVSAPAPLAAPVTHQAESHQVRPAEGGDDALRETEALRHSPSAATSHAASHSPREAEPVDHAAELASLARQAATPPQAAAFGRSPEMSRPLSMQRWLSVVGVLLLVVVAFASGWMMGARRTPTPTPASTAGAAEAGEKPAQPSGETSPPPAAVTSSSSASPAVRGRITFKNSSGDSRPDRGARVIVFPPQRSGEAKLSLAGFRAGDAAADYEVARAALRALGGDVAIVQEDGSYEVFLPAAGQYSILVISHYQPRDTDDAIAPALRSLLAEYFDRPEQLLGLVSYHFSQVRYQGEQAQLWDHSF